MAIESVNGVPDSARVGDTWRFSLNYADFPASSWSLAFFCGGKEIAGTSDGDSFLVVVPASQSKDIAPGNQPWLARVTDGTDTATADSGTIQALASIAVKSEKSFARKTLEACEAALLKLAGGTNLKVNINGQEFTKRDIKELRDLHDWAVAKVKLEEMQTGERSSNCIIHTRFKPEF
jgi:hypothetical protein